MAQEGGEGARATYLIEPSVDTVMDRVVNSTSDVLISRNYACDDEIATTYQSLQCESSN